jgi:uncharacterized protein YkwD
MIPLPLRPKELGVVLVVGIGLMLAYTAVTPGPETIEADSLESQIESNINDARETEELPPLAESDRLGQQARSYSKEQARNDFIGHDSPVSGPMSARLSCRPSGENINTAYYVQEFVSDGEERYLNNESQVADYIVESWLRSEGHRSNIMDRRFSTQGVGINVTERDGDAFVIATQQLCG